MLKRSFPSARIRRRRRDGQDNRARGPGLRTDCTYGEHVTDATSTRPGINWLNIIFLLGTLLAALISTPWYLMKYGLGWPEAVTFLVIWLFVWLLLIVVDTFIFF